MGKVESLSRRLGAVVGALVWLIPLGWAALLMAAWLVGKVNLPGRELPMSALSPGAVLGSMALASLHVAVVVAILVRLRRLLRLWAQGQVFVLASVDLIRQMALLLILYGFVTFAASLALGQLLYWLEGVPDMLAFVEVDLPVLFIGLLVVLLSRIMREAVVMADDVRLTI